MPVIPQMLRKDGFRFVLLPRQKKYPPEANWQTEKNYKYDDPKLLEHLAKGGNYGVICGIGGLVVIEVDDPEVEETIAEAIKNKELPNTFTVKSKCGFHRYYLLPESIPSIKFKSKPLLDENGKPVLDENGKPKEEDTGQVQGKDHYVVGPGSQHPEGPFYTVADGADIATISTEQLKVALYDWLKEETTPTTNIPEGKTEPPDIHFQKIIPPEKWALLWKRINKNGEEVWQGPHPFHDSKNGINFVYTVPKRVWRCFRGNHESGGSAYELIAVKHGLLSCEECKPGALRGDKFKIVKDIAIREYGLKPTKKPATTTATPTEPTDADLAVLQDTKLFERCLNEISKRVVGEKNAVKVIFLCSQGRLVENCQVSSYNLLVNSGSGAGKDYVVNNVLKLLPRQCFEQLTRISPTVFTYWHDQKVDPNWTWDGKVFCCEDISEGVLNHEVFKVMASSGSKAVVVINQIAYEKIVNGKPVMITTTASATPDPELLRRFVILNLDESEGQTREVMKLWTKHAKKGDLPEYDNEIINTQKFLRRVKVRIPYADHIADKFPSKHIQMRTNFPRFLDFVKASTAFHQFQREEDDEGFLIATGEDYEIARQCYQALFTNKFMVSLTKNQRDILNVLEKKAPDILLIASEVEQDSPLTLKTIQLNLETLVNYGLVDKGEKQANNRSFTAYKVAIGYRQKELVSIPTFAELEKQGPEKQKTLEVV